MSERYDFVDYFKWIVSTHREYRNLLDSYKCNTIGDVFPDPDMFRYLHEYSKEEGLKGGILVIGLNPHGKGSIQEMEKWETKYRIDPERHTSDRLLDNYRRFL